MSFIHPHDPFNITRAYWDRYRGRAIDDPITPAATEVPLDEPSRQLRAALDLDGLDLSGAEVRTARRAYYAAISYLDDCIGKVLAALRERDRGRPTAIIFVADHGEMLGERGLWFKMSFFERSARVPMIITGPGIAPTRVATPVSLIDLLPTLLDVAGVGADSAGTPPEGAWSRWRVANGRRARRPSLPRCSEKV